MRSPGNPSTGAAILSLDLTAMFYFW